MKKILYLISLLILASCGTYTTTIHRNPNMYYWNSPQWYWYDYHNPHWDNPYTPRYYFYVPRKDDRIVRPQPNRRPSYQAPSRPRQVVPQNGPSRNNSRNRQR